MQVDYIDHWGSDLTPVNAARVSMNKESDWELVGYEDEYDEDSRIVTSVPTYKLSDKDAKLINYLAKHKHTSCFEHQGATLRLKVPIFIARQIQRHRTFSYNEISRRYVDTPPEFFWPDAWRKRAEDKKQGSTDEPVDTMTITEDEWVTTPESVAGAAARQAVWAYNMLLQGGVAPEQARMVLPQNMYTTFYMSGNLRAWNHFLALRLDGHAQKEVQDVAKQVQVILEPLWPVSMEALMEHYDA